MCVHIVAAAHRRLDAAAAVRALGRGDNGTVIFHHATGHQTGSTVPAGQSADRHVTVMAVVLGHPRSIVRQYLVTHSGR